jgi:uncharacterized Fe-S cluster protein YjdI
MEEYKKEDVTILWNASICTHSGICARQLGEVFKPREKPWINTDNASKESIIKQVGKCPSGALSMKD